MPGRPAGRPGLSTAKACSILLEPDRANSRQACGMKYLDIKWQRLVDERGQTCQRCSVTQHALDTALATLRQVLAPLGIVPRLEFRQIPRQEFQAAPGESNRIWIAGQPLENWLQAEVGSSPCCAACGDADCRTVELEGQAYEAVPEVLIIRAALMAAAQLQGPQRTPACC